MIKTYQNFEMVHFSYQASKDDIAVYAALNTPPSSEYVNAARWYNHIDALLRLRYAHKVGLVC